MRRILVDNARRKAAAKRGGRRERQELDGVAIAAPAPADERRALDEELSKFEAQDPVKARRVKLRYVAGLSEEEAAHVLGVSRTAAHRYWRYAKACLLNELGREEGAGKSLGA